MSAPRTKGFSAVELLITILVGILFFLAIGQLYSTVISDSAVTRNKAIANSLAYTRLRRVTGWTTGACVTSTSTDTLTTAHRLPLPATMVTTIDCPYSAAGYANTAVKRMTVTITYGNPSTTVKQALYDY